MRRRTSSVHTALEGDLRAILRDQERFPSGAVSFGEFGIGGDAGLPDTWFAVDGAESRVGRYVAVELKRGPSVVKELRPSQRRWHRDSASRGIVTYGLTLHNGKVILFRLGQASGGLVESFVDQWAANDVNYGLILQHIALS